MFTLIVTFNNTTLIRNRQVAVEGEFWTTLVTCSSDSDTRSASGSHDDDFNVMPEGVLGGHRHRRRRQCPEVGEERGIVIINDQMLVVAIFAEENLVCDGISE